MIALAEPPAVVAPEPAVVSRTEETAVLHSRDLPLTLIKAGRREDAFLRQAVFISSTILVVRPPEAMDASQDRYRWDVKAYEQRQLCVSSITGLFMCEEAQTKALAEVAQGEAPLAEEGTFPSAVSARTVLSDSLKARAVGLFEAARASQVQPMFRAAGVAVAVAR